MAETPEGDQWPEGYDTWTHERRQAYWIARFREDLDYVPTAEEKAAAEHLGDKMASACGWNQRDPDAYIGKS